MEMSLENLSIDEGEDEVWLVAWDEDAQKPIYEFCLISDLGEKRFLFQFFNEIDIARVENGAPWTFNNHLLISHWLKEEDDPMLTPMIHDNFWVQVHDLPPVGCAKAIEKEKEIDDFIFKVHLCQFQYLSSKSSSYGEENRNRMGSIIEGTTKECDEHKQYLAKGGMHNSNEGLSNIEAQKVMVQEQEENPLEFIEGKKRLHSEVRCSNGLNVPV
ncbi:hypothetical protein Golax_000052 [Gossypium laxum]|uniref:DUF4283 domain-containing protein n=1 Tax=Gossypium laxum TaxID=34288 RepID=A0A7J9B3K3_9ROSI|nr:hypothetical protein [Gossypium laxum]